MTAQHAIAVDLANVYDSPERNTLLYTLAWGDFVEVLEVTERHVRIATHTYEERPLPTPRTRPSRCSRPSGPVAIAAYLRRSSASRPRSGSSRPASMSTIWQ